MKRTLKCAIAAIGAAAIAVGTGVVFLIGAVQACPRQRCELQDIHYVEFGLMRKCRRRKP